MGRGRPRASARGEMGQVRPQVGACVCQRHDTTLLPGRGPSSPIPPRSVALTVSLCPHASNRFPSASNPAPAPAACPTLEYPKSHILSRGAGLPSNSVFSSFRSRWHTPWG